jgi:hypothetical protein
MTVRARSWKQKDPLYRGDAAAAVAVPVPGANPSIVRHILYLEGAGRETPYLSASESLETAERFAGNGGRVWSTTTAAARKRGVTHVGHTELLVLLNGKGKGKAKWSSAFEVQQARRYVEQHLEHLLDFSGHTTLTTAELEAFLVQLFQQESLA